MRAIPLTVAFAAILATGGVHGLWTARWNYPRELEEAVARLDGVPLVIGDWHGRVLGADAEMFARAGAVGYWMRRYDRKGQSVTVILMCGPAGKMSVHRPDDCYRGVGYEVLGAPTTHRLEGMEAPPAEFFTARFRKPQSVAPSQLRIDWSWNASGTWQAPDSPRWTFRGEPFLYKLYLVREMLPNENLKSEPNIELLRLMLPVLQQALFTPKDS